MKVCIISEGNFEIGYGHITRCTAIHQAFEERGIIPYFIVNGDETVNNTLKVQRKYIFNWLIDFNQLLSLIDGSEVVIIDSYLAPLSIYKRISEIAKKPVFIDDNVRLKYPPGLVVNYSIFANTLHYPDEDSVKYLLGPEYCLVRNEFWNLKKKKKINEIKNVLITFGGSDMKNLTPPILEMLNNFFPNLKKKIIIGKSFKNIGKIEAQTDKNCELIYYPTAEGMKKVMMESDLAITAGGTTIYELSIVGVPAISIAVAENQLNNAKSFSKLGLNYFAGWWRDKNLLEKIREFILLLKKKELRKKMINTAQKLIKSDGSRRLIDFIIKNSNMNKDI